MTRRRLLALLVASLSLAPACGLFDDAFEVDATVQFLAVEGGCWSLLAATGPRYEPIDLPAEFRVDDLPVHARLEIRAEIGSICQIGPLVEILSIKRRDTAG